MAVYGEKEVKYTFDNWSNIWYSYAETRIAGFRSDWWKFLTIG